MDHRRAVRRFLRHSWLGLLLPILSAFAQEASPAAQNKSSESELLKPGVVIGVVGKTGAAEKAGLQAGDTILRWSQGKAGGPIASPLDLSVIQHEHQSLGLTRLEGFRGTEERAWVLGTGEWHLTARPNFSESMRPIYLEASQAWKTDPPKAIAGLDALRKRFQEYGPVSTLGWLTYQKAVVLLNAQRREEADEAFKTALVEAAQEDPRISTDLRLSWGDLIWRTGDLTSVEGQYRQALADADRADPESILSALALRRLASVALARTDLALARVLCQRALDILGKRAPESPELATDSGLMGMVEQTEGNLAEAESDYLRMLHIQENSIGQDNSEFSSTLILLGNLTIDRGDLIQAEQYYHRTFLIERQASGGNIPSSLIGLGLVASQRGDLNLAEKDYRAAIEADKKLAPWSTNTGEALGDLASVFLDRGDLHGAETYYRQALDVFEKVAPSSLNVAEVLAKLGEVSQKTGNLATAEEFLLRSLAIAEKIAPQGRQTAETLAELGDVARESLKLESAENYYRKALAIEERLLPGAASYAQTLAALGGIMRQKSQFTAATSIYEQALRALENQTAHLGGSSEVRTDFRAKHESYYREYIDLLLTHDQLELALEAVERSRARTLLETLATAHVDIRQGVDPALLKRERSLQTNLRGKLERRIQLLTDQHTEDQVTAVDKEISELTSEYQNLESQIRTASPGYAALTQPQPLNAQQIRQLLDSDTLLLEYSLGQERSYVFAITQNDLKVFQLPKRADVEAATRKVYNLLTALNHNVPGETPPQTRDHLATAEPAYVQSLMQLSQMVLGPVAEQLQGKRLLVVADGALQYIPFQAMPEPQAGKKTIAGTATPLIVQHEVVNLPSASVLAVLRQQAEHRQIAPRVVAVLADPVFDRGDARIHARSQPLSKAAAAQESRGVVPLQDDPTSSPVSAGLLTRSADDVGLRSSGELHLPRLLYSRQEADSILALTPRGQGMETVDFKANRAAAMDPALSQYRIVHFATHGLLNSEHPEFSGLVFSLVNERGKAQDGFLQLQDIYNLNLSADVVVLSSCETALGKEISGEGLVGLTRGFMYAGATRVVASLWNVSDAATARLMADFYRAMEHDGLRPAAALRSAQIQMWKQKRWSSPYFWAAFQIQGEWR